MSGFEWDVFHRERGQRDVTARQWLAEQPRWAKVAYLFIALPAWALIIFNIITGRSSDLSSVIAFGAFAGVALLLMLVSRRRKLSSPNG